jgi:hypothetical protein
MDSLLTRDAEGADEGYRLQADEVMDVLTDLFITRGIPDPKPLFFVRQRFSVALFR